MRVAPTLVLIIVVARAGRAFNHCSAPKAGDSLVKDESRREFLSILLSAAAVKPVQANAENAQQNAQHTISGIMDPQLRDYYNPSMPNWQGTSLPGPLSLSEAYKQVSDINSQPVLNMGKWPDPILRYRSSPIPSSAFQSKTQLNQLNSVAIALRNTARKEGAVGLAAQQCGVDVSLIFIDSVYHSDTSKKMQMGGMSSGTFGDAMNGVFGQSSWRKSQKQITGEGAYVDDIIPMPRKWSRNYQQQVRDENGIFLVNPRIIHRSPESEMLVWSEQCLVLPPEFRATLLRDAEVTIEYESLESRDGISESCGSTKQITLRGELARCAQHEMDHDRGTLIVDHVSLEELGFDGNMFMADIENADGLHPERMQHAYSRELSESVLLPSDEKMVSLAMENRLGYHNRLKQIENGYVYEDVERPWFVQAANAVDEESPSMPTITPPKGVQSNLSQSVTNTKPPDCDENCLQERKRRVAERRAMMQQSRSNTRREDVLELSQQRASLYGAEFKGLPPQYCSGFCP
ncbi:hypothetical protein ACHAXR_006827 [Thalassiosira sp. AJA248-18]